jgi:hypothetical protein
MDKNYVLKVLTNNGFSDEKLDWLEIESGSEEWMDVVSEITGKDAYEGDFSDEDNKKIEEFIDIMVEMGISFY